MKTCPTHLNRSMICGHRSWCCCYGFWFLSYRPLFLCRCYDRLCGSDKRLNQAIDVRQFSCLCLFSQFMYDLNSFFNVRLSCGRSCGCERCYVFTIWFCTGSFWASLNFIANLNGSDSELLAMEFHLLLVTSFDDC